MRGHLTDSEMTALLAGVLETDALVHVMPCGACRQEYVRLRAALVEFVASAHAEAERSDRFFQAQRARITRCLWEGRPPVRHWRSAWAPALAAAALAALFLTRGGPPLQEPRDPETDQALLNAVQHAIRAEVPAAFRPVTLLLAEVEREVTYPDYRINLPQGDQP